METKWTLREQLILASAVQKSGDQNWVSVTRAIKPLMEDKRQHDFFSQKNCAMQYAKMLDKANTPKRTKRASRDADVTGETAQEVIVRQLTEKRIVELDQLLERIKEEYMITKKEIEDLQNDKLTEKEMQLMLEEMSSSQKTVEDLFGSAVHSPLGTDESKTVDNTMDMDTTVDVSQSKVSVVGEYDPHHSVPVVHTPLVQCVRSKEQPEVKSPGGSTSPEVVSPLPVEHLSQKTSRAVSMSPTPSEPYSSPQMKSPPQSVETQHQSDTPAPSPPPQLVGERTSQVEEAELVPATEEEELFYASVSWCEKEHAYASKSTSPSSFYRASPIPTLLPTNSSLAYTDATLVSKVKSMIVAMGNENVLVSDYKVAVDGKCEEPSQSLFHVGKQDSQEMDKEPGDVDSKSEDEEMEKMDDSGKKDEQDSAVVKVDDKKMDEDESERPISPKEAPHEEERDDEGREDLPLSPKPEQFSKEQSRSPDIDVESITSSPPTKDHDDDTPSVTPIATKGSRKGKAKRKGAKKEVVEEPTKSEEKVKDRVSSLKGKTRSSKRGGAKKEDSEAEEEEIVTPRRSGRVKDKKEKQEDSEMEESTAQSSTVNSPVPSLSDLTPDVVQSHKAWKKAIMLVWRQIAQHKYANLFLQPVKDDDATGYSEVVHRPVDLSSIKKNIESGVIRSDIVFQRDILLMFQNALMYNSSDHDVYKMAEEMRSDSMEYIQDYLATQLMVSQSTGKPTVRTRRAEAQERADEDLVHKKGSRKPSSEETSHTAAKRKKL